MTHPTTSDRPWFTFRRAFLWGLAAFTLLWSLRAEAGTNDQPTLNDPAALPLTPSDPAAAPAAPVEAAVLPSATNPSDASVGIPGASVTHFPESNWTVTIIPNAPSGSAATINGRRYDEVYASIPYRRAEYLADPGYRHEATMEVLFGQLRPKTTVSHYTPRTVPTPAFSVYKPYRASQSDYYRTWRGSAAPYSWNFPLTPYYPAYPAMPMLY